VKLTSRSHTTRDGPSGSDDGVLSVRGLERRFGQREVLGGLDLDLARGERVALRGPNGAGKTTLLRCIAGTLTATAGSVSIGGFPAGSVEAKRLVGVSLSQERSFYLRLTGRDNLLFFARVRGLGAAAATSRVRELEAELELGEILRQRVHRCSTGMVQQLSFARALLGKPAVLLLDEPTRSLDADAHERVWRALERRDDTAVLIASHDEEDVGRCHRHVALSRTEPVDR
jgi:ABC-type multidrug transport system ATPase subunit